jgi:putative transcriptional regulator
MTDVNRQLLIESVRNVLQKSGFEVSEEFVGRTICFDVIARRDKTLLVIKVLVNIDSLNKSSANELKVISNLLGGSPIVVGIHSGCGIIEDGAVYLRHNVPIMSPQTVTEYFYDDRPPLVFAAPGGFFVKIDGDKLKKIRKEKGLSLGAIAEAIGVSRRAVQMYEDGMSAMVDIAIKLEDFINEPIIIPSDPLDAKFKPAKIDDLKCELGAGKRSNLEVIDHLTVLGYDVIHTRYSPFDAITEKKKILILTGIERKTKYLKRRAKVIHNISQLVEKHSVFIVQKSESLPNIEGTPVIALEELLSIEDSNEILELINKRI